jgi:hypothetical protein
MWTIRKSVYKKNELCPVEFHYTKFPIHQRINFKTWNTRPDKQYDVWFTISEAMRHLIQVGNPCLFRVKRWGKYCRKD